MALTAACLPRIVSVTSSCGCTLTAASIRGLTPGEMEALGNKEIDLARVIATAAEAKALGVQERGLAVLLRSSVKDIKPAIQKKNISEQSIILPYIQRRQRSILNANYWSIEAGVATTGAGMGSIPASAWDVTVNLGPSPFKSPLTNIERYFLPGATLIVLTWASDVNKTARTLQFTVYASVNANAGGVQKAKVTLVPNVSAEAWAGFTTPQKLVYQPIFGVGQTGANNVANRESWCYNQPADLSAKIIYNWLQTTRESRCVTESYKKMLDLIMQGKVNDYQKAFVNLPLADQNKRQSQLAEDAWLRSIWYNQRINELQEPETYDSLPKETDVEDPTCVHGYKANALGIRTMLADCQRVVDYSAGRLSLDYIFDQCYYLMRNRQSDGDNVSVIDVMTDRITAAEINDTMAKYYKQRYGWDTTRFAKIGEKITHDNQVLFNYNIYDLPDQGLQLAVFWDPFFDDQLAGTSATAGGANDFKSRTRQLWFIDWSDVSIGLAGTMSVTRKQPDPETNVLYKCVMQANPTEYNLRSQRWTVMLDRPARHLLIENFSSACPSVTAAGCNVS